MRNGCGDDWFLLFDRNGAALKGFAHEYPLASNSTFAMCIRQEVPPVFESFLNEPAFSMNMASFCIWRRHTDSKWNVVSPPSEKASPELDGSAELISIFDGKPESYWNWAMDYYEREISLAAVEAIYVQQPLDNRLISVLNPALSLSDIHVDVCEIGYPVN
jgi:hypothetical protein